ncbi:MAG: tetratricopeptide repeat protein [Verrucomicrobia bacterium]|nr:tetratricopeptide repeat protein [Verrucomicrobiota bacterium]
MKWPLKTAKSLSGFREMCGTAVLLRSSTIAWLLVLINIAVFAQVAGHQFVRLDDDVYVFENPHIRDGFTWKGIGWAFGAGLLERTPHADYWQPVTFLSRMLDIECFGFDPLGHHLVNLGFHIANTLLLFHLLYRMTTLGGWQAGSVERCAWIAAMFAIHPMHVEPVAWVTARKDMLSGFFWMLTLLAYCQHLRSPAIWRYALVLAFFVLGLMAKPMNVTLPFTLLLLDYWPLNRFRFQAGDRIAWSRAILEKCPFFSLSVLSGLFTLLAQSRQLHQESAWGTASRILVSYTTYLFKTFAPIHLAVWYPPHQGPPPLLQIGGAILAMGIVSTWVVRRAQSSPWLLVGWLWFLSALAPVIALNDIAGADRFTYLPLIGIFIMLAWGFSNALSGVGSTQRVLGAAAILSVLLAMALSWRQTRCWRDSVALFEHAVRVTDGNWLAHNNLGIALRERNDLDGAVRHFDEALRLKPGFAKALYNKGDVLSAQGKFEDAVVWYSRAIQAQSDYAEAFCNMGNALHAQGRLEDALLSYERALKARPSYAEARSNMGAVCLAQGRFEEAAAHCTEALRLNPGLEKAHNDLGVVFSRMGEVERATFHCMEALRLKPDFTEARVNLGNVFMRKGSFNQAIAHYTEALHINPGLAKARNNLGLALARLGRQDEALRHYRRALQLAPGDPEILANLANAMSRLEQFDQAIQCYERALQVNPNVVETHYNLAMTLMRQGNCAKAEEHLRAALTLRPAWSPAQRALDEIRRQPKSRQNH